MPVTVDVFHPERSLANQEITPTGWERFLPIPWSGFAPPRCSGLSCDTAAMAVDGLDERLALLPRERRQALPALHILHEIAGYLAPDGLEQIGRWLHIPNSDLYAVATSYSEFRTIPEEPGTIGVCRGLSCRLAGSVLLTTALRDAGRRVEERECFFACAVAPVAEVAGEMRGLASLASLEPAS
jgi:NADH:ubiquinone oxidoreductase subunit E